MFEYIIDDETKTEEIILVLKPEAPISLTSSKGTFNKTNIRPSYTNLLGLLENILGLHFGRDLRNIIVKQYKLNVKGRDIRAFISLIEHKVDFLEIVVPKNYETFVDLFSHLNSRIGDAPHINGIKTCDIRLVHHKKSDLISSNHTEHLPMYYTSVYKREYFITDDVYKIKIKTTPSIKKSLIEKIEICNSFYLGNSDGIITVSIV